MVRSSNILARRATSPRSTSTRCIAATLLDILNDNPVFRNVLTDVIKSHNNK